MPKIPRENGTPFSLPRDTPENMPIDYPELDNGTDAQEAYDEGLEDTIDFDPYRLDDDTMPLKSGVGTIAPKYYTNNHDIIRNWTTFRYGHPAHILGEVNGLENGGLYITFEDDEPDIDVEPISWKKFFEIFDKNELAFLYKRKRSSGVQSKFYKFISKYDVAHTTPAIKVN